MLSESPFCLEVGGVHVSVTVEPVAGGGGGFGVGDGLGVGAGWLAPPSSEGAAPPPPPPPQAVSKMEIIMIRTWLNMYLKNVAKPGLSVNCSDQSPFPPLFNCR